MRVPAVHSLTVKVMSTMDVDSIGQQNWMRGICGICPAGCWVEVDVRDGQLKNIRADETHPLGMICRRGRHAAEIVHSEHRLTRPLRRVGPKGSYEFEPISWDEAYDEIVSRLVAIKDESGPEATAIYTGRGAFELSLCDMYQPKGVAVSSASSVLFEFGSPNTMGVGALCYTSFAMIAPHLTMGRMLIDMFTDIENAEFLVVWGANPATDSPPLDMHRLDDAAGRGAEVVVIDPRRTETADRTGAEWVPIRPGTDGALALSMIGVLIDEELYDEDFVDEWCLGFDELETYVQHFSPEVAEAITGVPSDTIRRLARRIATASGACPVMYTGLEYSDSGVQAIRAVLVLFALAGQLDVPGGIGLAMPDSHFPINRSCNVDNPSPNNTAAADSFPIYTMYRGECHASGLIKAVLEGDPYPIRSLIIHGASLLTSWPETPLWRKVLSELEFVVTIDRTLTADSAYADIVLPATTMFEIESYMVYGPIFRLRKRLIDPVGESRNDYAIIAELADRLGYGHLYPKPGEALIREALEGSGFTLEDVEAEGGTVKLPPSMMEYKKWQKGRLRADGLPGFDTPSGKFEIASTVLDDFGYEPLPKYTEPEEGPLASPDVASQFPLVFNSGARLQTAFRSQHHGIAGLADESPEPTVEINISDATRRGIRSGDLVEVRTPRGAVEFRAEVTDTIVAGAVECAMGGGTPVGPAAWQERNVNDLTDMSRYDEITGFPIYKALLCDVTKLDSGSPRESQSVGESGARPSTDAVRKREPGPSAPVHRRVYLDNNATTAVSAEVREAMLPYLESTFGNPSSIHKFGKDARSAVEEARRQVAGLIGARPKRIVFTGGGSEADNLALKGVAMSGPRRHVITTAIEHPAILKTAAYLERFGCEVTYLGVDSSGLVDPGELRDALRDDTALVSVMLANNEVGTIEPIAELCSISHEAGALFHTDAVQGAGKIEIDVERLGVDLLSLSGHKLHGPKGVGAIYVRRGVHLEPLVHGGGQESGTRAGTENVPAIVGMGRAAELAGRGIEAAPRMIELRDELETRIRELLPAARLNGHRQLRLPNTLNLTIPTLRGESLVVALSRHGIALSSGSACKAGSPEPTHVLLAMGLPVADAHCSIRISLCADTKMEDVEATITAVRNVLEEMESTILFLPCK